MNLINKRYKPGEEVAYESQTKSKISNQKNSIIHWLIWFAKTHRLQVFFWLRELIWKIGHWNSPELNNFIDKYCPDLIFLPLYHYHYTNDIGLYIKKRTGKKMVVFVADDVYTLKQCSLSILYWIDHLIMRLKIRSVVKESTLMYVISRLQQEEYNDIFQLPCRILTKCGNFIGDAPIKQSISKPMTLIYTGNIGAGRWKSLAEIGTALRYINRDGVKAQLFIYTLSPLTCTMKRKLNDGKNIFLKGSLDANNVEAVQSNADILVHVESFEKKYYLKSRLSFSTKIVDYLQRARCIFALGSKHCASIDYIDKNNAGVVVSNRSDISNKLNMLVENPALVQKYGNIAYNCGREHHQSDKIKGMLKTDILSIINQE